MPRDPGMSINVANEAELAALCVRIIGDAAALSPAEKELGKSSLPSTPIDISTVSSQIQEGNDPLGKAFSELRTPQVRRTLGQTWTPVNIVAAMLDWAKSQTRQPVRIVDPGAGSGRYMIDALTAFPQAHGLASEIDPLAALILRANIAAMGLTDRVTVVVGDYRALNLTAIDGVTLFIGNPPYVRHHHINQHWKTWLVDTAKKHGVSASKLAGLHAYFFLATAEYANPGDFGVFITSSEWLDVNYGELIRKLFIDELGGTSIHVIDPQTQPFEDAAATGVITTFEVGETPEQVCVEQVEDADHFGSLDSGKPVSRSNLQKESRWSVFLRTRNNIPSDYIELGEIARVHRGAVTGANRAWVVERDKASLPLQFLFPSVTRASELFEAGAKLTTADRLRLVIDLPEQLDEITNPHDRYLVDAYLDRLRKVHVDQGYIASNRAAWWRVGLKPPAPILATYMARRPPAFVRNIARARHINIAHGIYPRTPMSARQLDFLVDSLNKVSTLDGGRVYSGGLTKFEPREMERIAIPNPMLIQEESPDATAIGLV